MDTPSARHILIRVVALMDLVPSAHPNHFHTQAPFNLLRPVLDALQQQMVNEAEMVMQLLLVKIKIVLLFWRSHSLC